MNKRILCLCLILIALMGISVVSACPADNCTDEMSLYGSCWVDPEQSRDSISNSGVSWVDPEQSRDSISNRGVSWVDPEQADEHGFNGVYEVSRDSMSNRGVSWVDPEQSRDSISNPGISWVDPEQALADEDNIVSESGRASNSHENFVEDNLTTLSNEDKFPSAKDNISDMDMKEKEHINKELVEAFKENKSNFTPIFHDKNYYDIKFDPATGSIVVNLTEVPGYKNLVDVKDEGIIINAVADIPANDGFIINAVAGVPAKNQNTFLPQIENMKNLFALDFDPATGILKVNPNCKYMNSAYVNSTDLTWYVKMYNYKYLSEMHSGCTYLCEIGDGYDTRVSKEFNITRFLTECCAPIYYCNGYYTCEITVDVLGAKDFSVDFVFPVKIDENNNIKYLALEKSVAHVSGKNFKIYDQHDAKFNPSLIYDIIINNIISAQKKANK